MIVIFILPSLFSVISNLELSLYTSLSIFNVVSISISDLAIDVFGSDDEKREGFTEYMSSLNFDDEVIIDKPTAIKKLSKIKIKIDKDTTLNIYFRFSN